MLLRRAVMSVLAQTYPNFRVCVYDNASGDETENIVGDLAAGDDRVKYFSHQHNIGAMPNFIFGMNRVQTPFFSLLSDDDVLLPEFFEKALAGFDKYPDAIFSALATIQMKEDGTVVAVPLSAWKQGVYPPPTGLLTMLDKLYADDVLWTSILFRRDVLEKVGTLDLELGAPADLDYELRIAARWPIAISTEPGAIFVVHNESISGTLPLETIWPAYQRIALNVRQQEMLSPQQRLEAYEQILRFFRQRALRRGGLGYIVNQRWNEAEYAATILRDFYHCPIHAALLQGISRLARHSPLCLHVLQRLSELRKTAYARFKPEVAPEYAHYSSLLRCDSLSEQNHELRGGYIR
jgi:cellulose synthase/poly-beta-1,6-N-acetylglucosamine synthase-like glycosyltransferase